MSVRPQHLPALGLTVLVVAVGAAACGSRTVVGQQNGGHGGGAGAGQGGQGGYAGTFDCNPTIADCVGTGGTTGVAGTFGEAGTTGGAGTFGFAGTTGLGGSGVPTGEAGGPGACAVGGSGATGLAFRPAVEYPIHRESWSVALGDLNGDSRPDFAVTNIRMEDQMPVGGAGGSGGSGEAGTTGQGGFGYSGSVSVLLSDTGSGYAAPQHYLVGTTSTSIAAADLNSDGKVDLAVSDPRGVNVLFNDGTGRLSPPVSFAVGTYPASVALADLNGDGRTDMAVANSGDGGPSTADVAVLLNMGTGTFVARNYPAGTRPIAIAIGDLDGDTRPDLAVASGASVSVLINNGNSTFTPPASYGFGTMPQAVSIGDLNGDGKADLALLSAGGGAAVALNIGSGMFAAAINYAIPAYGSIAIGDLNGDGKPDLASVMTWPCYAVTVLPNTGNGTFAETMFVGLAVTPRGSVTLGNLDGDGRLDLVLPTVDGVAVLLNAR